MDGGSGTGVHVRPARGEDMDEVLGLYRLLAGTYAAQDTGDEDGAAGAGWRQLTADRFQRVLVAEAAGRIAGTATIIMLPTLGGDGRPWAAVENVVVAQAHRGKGVGALLMAAVIQLCRTAECSRVFLSSNIARQEAHEFYRRLGWSETHLGFAPAGK